MFCEESVIIGDYHNYELKIGDGKNSEKVIKIANEIANLKNFHNEYVIVDLEHKERDDSARVSFFQLCKCKSYSKLSRYYVEIRVEEGTSAKLYNKTAGKKEVLRLFEEICVERKFPDLNSWKMFFDFNGDKKLDDRDEEKISHYTNVAVSFFNGENTPEDNCLYVDAIKYLAEHDSNTDLSWEDCYLDELERMGLGDQIVADYKFSVNPFVLERLGLKYLHGKGCPVDYKKAYRYFDHADKRGNLHARHHLSLMYKHGLYVKKNYDKYVKLNESALNDYVNIMGGCLPPTDILLIELAKIHKEKGNRVESLKYALTARRVNDARECPYVEPDNMPEILDLIYSAIPFDKTDMDVYDLLYLLKTPAKAKIFTSRICYDIESVNLNGYCMVKFNGQYYKSILDFFCNAKINDKPFCEWLECVDYVEVA